MDPYDVLDPMHFVANGDEIHGSVHAAQQHHAHTHAHAESEVRASTSSVIPLASDVQRIMRKLSDELFTAWRDEIAQRLRDLEFSGYISKGNIQVSDAVWRLPNTEVRKALGRLQKLLADAGYEYEFRFQDVDEVNWILFYSVDLPEREDSDSETETER